MSSSGNGTGAASDASVDTTGEAAPAVLVDEAKDAVERAEAKVEWAKREVERAKEAVSQAKADLAAVKNKER